MKRLMIVIAMMVPLMTPASLFSERSGEIFQATREGPGELALGLIYVGVIIPPVGLATVPAGIAVAAVDELVVSPVVDLCCLPYDLVQPRPALVLLVAIRPAPPRDNARRRSHRPRERMGAGHAPRVQRQAERVVQCRLRGKCV